MKKTYLILFLIGICIRSSGQDNNDLLMRARALSDRGKLQEAISLLSESAAVTTDARILVALGDARMNSGNYAEAVSAYNRANTLSPASGEYGLARVSAIKGEARNSLAHLELNINSGYRKAEKEIMLDPVFSVIENTADWRNFWKTERYSFTERKVSELEYCIGSGKIDEAMQLLNDLKSQYPGENATLYARALTDCKLQKYGDVMAVITTLIAGDGKNEKYLRLLATAQSASGNWAGATDTYSSLLSSGVTDPLLYLKRAECYRRTGETSKAEADLGKYISLYPENNEALSLAGRLAQSSGENLKALDYFSVNLKLHPNDPQCYIDRANSYFSSRSWDYAVSDYSMSLDIKPDNADVWLNKGISLLNIGKTQDACHDFRRALSLGNKKAASYINTNCIK
ncbi:MAG TPA: tetratricopeptide repeat protein [Bacteroidales bacterium]|nr:tetratricopeptide repeat protein [Bacteroidales bacterium]